MRKILSLDLCLDNNHYSSNLSRKMMILMKEFGY